MKDHFVNQRKQILQAALPHVPFDGWSDRLLAQAIVKSGVDANVAVLAFPDGPMDLLEFYWAEKDAALSDAIAASAPLDRHLSRKVANALRIYIELLRPEREAVRRALALGALPHNMPHALTCLYRTVDTIWRAVGDNATDFNFYTKRATLAAVVGATVTHWLGEAGDEGIDAFIDRRIGDIMRFEQIKARVRAAAGALPSPARIIGRLFGHAG